MNKFEREEARELKRWQESRFLGIIENEMDECLKTGDEKQMKRLYGIYVAQRRWLWLYEREARKSMEISMRQTRAAREEQQKAGTRLPKLIEAPWFESLQLGVITAVDKINEDTKLCSCKADKKRVAWINFMFRKDFKKTEKKKK